MENADHHRGGGRVDLVAVADGGRLAIDHFDGPAVTEQRATRPELARRRASPHPARRPLDDFLALHFGGEAAQGQHDLADGLESSVSVAKAMATPCRSASSIR